MYIKLLLLGQILAFICIVNLAQGHDEETTLEPVITTIEPEVQATAIPDKGLEELDQGPAQEQIVAAEPETTVSPVETTVPPITEKPEKQHAHPPHPYPSQYPNEYNPLTPEENRLKHKSEYPGNPYLGYPILRSPYSPYSPYGSPPFNPNAPYPTEYAGPTTPDADSDENPESDEKKKSPKEEKNLSKHPNFGYPPVLRSPYSPYSPYGSPPFNPHAPYPTGYAGQPFSDADSDEKPKSDEKEKSPKEEKKPAEHPNFGYPPFLRSPYSPYSPHGSPPYYRPAPSPQFPGFTPGLPYGGPSPPDADSDENPKSDEKVKSDEEEKKSPEQPSYGYPPLYVIQRRPFLHSYPYPGPARGYGQPYAYGR